jgi:hypothetical protein
MAAARNASGAALSAALHGAATMAANGLMLAVTGAIEPAAAFDIEL